MTKKPPSLEEQRTSFAKQFNETFPDRPECLQLLPIEEPKVKVAYYGVKSSRF